MKKNLTLTALLAVACGAMAQTGGDPAQAETFVAGGMSYTALDPFDKFIADGITYMVLDSPDPTVEVAESLCDPYTGDIVVPQTVSHDGTDYTVVAIGHKAFAYEEGTGSYNKVTSVKLPATIKTISSKAFMGSNQLSEMELPDGIVEIGSLAFYNCSNLVIDKLPSSLTTLGSDAFNQCYSLTDSLTLPDGLEIVTSGAFPYCGMESLDTGDGVTVIESAAFYGCYLITSVTFGDRLESINTEAFSGCGGLEKVELPASCTYLGPQAFYACTGLKEVRVANPTPPEASQNTFNVDALTTPMPVYAQATLYVPRGSREAYAGHACWGQFENIVEADFTSSIAHAGADAAPKVSLAGLTLTISANGHYRVFAADGRAIAEGTAQGKATVQLPERGVYVVEAGGRAVKVAATR